MGAGPDDAKGEEEVSPWAKELEAARTALEHARAPRRPGRVETADSLDSPQVAYEMELAEHRSTLERLHRAELAARDVTIGYQQDRIAELEAEVSRLRTALQVLTGLGSPGGETLRSGSEARSEDGP
jgi:chromosome segregation ATPase